MGKAGKGPKSFIAVREPWPDRNRTVAMDDAWRPRPYSGIAGYGLHQGQRNGYESWLAERLNESGAQMVIEVRSRIVDEVWDNTVSPVAGLKDYPRLGRIIDVEIGYPKGDERIGQIARQYWRSYARSCLPHRLMLKPRHDQRKPLRVSVTAVGTLETLEYASSSDSNHEWRGLAAYRVPGTLAERVFNRYRPSGPP